jgi:hypothetical protein
MAEIPRFPRKSLRENAVPLVPSLVLLAFRGVFRLRLRTVFGLDRRSASKRLALQPNPFAL